MNLLKPYPCACGAVPRVRWQRVKALFSDGRYRDTLWRVECPMCGAVTASRWAYRDAAIRAWNSGDVTRPGRKEHQ